MTFVVAKDDLLAFAVQIFAAAGVEQSIARPWAEVLVWADLRGTGSHGVMRIPRYLEWLDQGAINRSPRPYIETDAGAIAVLEADRSPAAPAMLRAMDEAIARARVHNLGWCSARNISHPGAVGYFALRAAEQGMAAIVMTASGQPLMAYHGARVAGVSTNPLAIAFPAQALEPLLLDISTSAIAFGKLLQARSRNAEIPPGWGIDKDGKETTDPQKVETLVPLGGPKGSGLSLMIECLSSIMVGNPLIAGGLSGRKRDGGPTFNGIAMAVNLAAFGDQHQIDVDLEELAALLTSLPRAEGVDEILVPGQRGNATLSERERSGIPLAKGTWNHLVETAEKLGVRIPAAK